MGVTKAGPKGSKHFDEAALAICQLCDALVMLTVDRPVVQMAVRLLDIEEFSIHYTNLCIHTMNHAFSSQANPRSQRVRGLLQTPPNHK